MLLEGLQLTLRQHCELAISNAPQSALELMRSSPPFAVIVSDMRMPGMSGAEFLAQARELQPDATRILLTGQTDLANAIKAVNQGQVFRFLTKPCPPADLLATVRSGVEQHRLINAERELLDRTLKGSIAALTDALAISQPVIWGRASRLRKLVLDLAQIVGLKATWHLEVAAMIADLGFISLPPDTIQRVLNGATLSGEEATMLERAGKLTEQLLAHIPRMEPVLALLSGIRGPLTPASPLDLKVLKAGTELQRLDTAGAIPDEALARLRPATDPAVYAGLEKLRDRARFETRSSAVNVVGLRAGMTLLVDVTAKSGALLLTRGQVLSAVTIERIRNVHQVGGVHEPISVRVPEGD
jgi:response regulator RpfG family c-di-GMP phosphodiesterase